MVSYSAQTFSTPVIWVFRPTGENSGLTMWHRILHVYASKSFFELAMHCLVSANQKHSLWIAYQNAAISKLEASASENWIILWDGHFEKAPLIILQNFWQNFMLCLIKILFFCDIWVRLWLRIYFTEYQHPIPLEKLQPRLFLWRVSVLKS